MKTKSLLIVVLLFVSTLTFSQTIYVNSSAGNDAAGDGTVGNPYKTFHKGYTMVSSGGTLDLTGTFTWTDAAETGDVASDGYVISKSIIICGQSDGSTIIQADVTENTANRRVLTLSSGYTIELRYLTIRHGYSTTGNWYSDGGGGLKSLATLTMRKCIITNNKLNSLVNSNSGSGGGAYISGGNVTVTIDDCIFRYNSNTSSYKYGGGLAICSINNNVTLSNSTFNNNTTADGSGLFFFGSWSTPKPHIYNCTFTANSGGSYGACFLDRKGCYVTNCTFASNPSGGLVVYGDTFYLKNNISANNSTYDFYQYHSTTVSDNGYNIIGVASGNAVSWSGTTTIGVPANLNLSATLDANGSSNISPTLALLANSVAINAGSSSANGIFNVPCTDQRGFYSNSTKDIGAYEYQGLSSGPSVTSSASAISNLNYYSGMGPSTAQSFTISGTNLTGNVVLTAPSYFEISTTSTYSSSLTLIPASGTLAETSINVRLKAGYSVSTYTGTLTVVTNCDIENVSLSGAVISLPASTRIWTGNTSTSWNTSTNWSGNTVPISTWHAIIPAGAVRYPTVTNNLATPAACNNLTIEAGAECTIQENCGLTISGNYINNGNLYIKSSASGEGSLIINGTQTGTGTDHVERYLTGNQWHLISSPITNALAVTFEDIWLRVYNESTNTFGNYIQPPATPLPTGQGFSVWADVAETRIYEGTINCGNQGPFNASLTGFAGPNTGWNLKGNPYTSAIDWNAASGWTKTNLANSVYIWNNNQYASYVGGIGTNGGSRYIPKGQGFFVQATSSGASLSMNKNVQVHNSVSFLKNESEPANVIRVTVSANGYSDETAIAIRPESSDYFDPATDAVKFYGSSLAPQIYTIKDDNSQLAISCVNSIDDVFGKVIYTDYAQNGEHVITWSHTLQSGIIPTLYDNVAGIAIPAETPYIYSASDTDPTDRFVLTETTMIMETMENDINILESNNVLYIQNFTNNQSGDVTIFNVHGQIVLQFTGSIKDLSSLAPAVYVVKVNAGENTVVEKVVVK